MGYPKSGSKKRRLLLFIKPLIRQNFPSVELTSYEAPLPNLLRSLSLITGVLAKRFILIVPCALFLFPRKSCDVLRIHSSKPIETINIFKMYCF